MGVRLRACERTCCICRSKGDKRTLIRVVVAEGRLVVDDLQSLPGRGGYVHPTVECVSRMGQAQRWERALRIQGVSLEASQVAQVVKELMARVGGSAGLPEEGARQRNLPSKARP